MKVAEKERADAILIKLAILQRDGPLAEKGDGLYAHDQQFNATVVNFLTEADNQENSIKECNVEKLLNDAANLRDKSIDKPSFRWVHLPANNVSIRPQDIYTLTSLDEMG